jgi:hypothetical protein
MIEHVKQKVMENPAVQDTLQGALGVGMTATGGAGLAGKIDLASSFLALGLSIGGIVVTVLTAINLYYKFKQRKFDYEQSIKYEGEDRRSN